MSKHIRLWYYGHGRYVLLTTSTKNDNIWTPGTKEDRNPAGLMV